MENIPEFNPDVQSPAPQVSQVKILEKLGMEYFATSVGFSVPDKGSLADNGVPFAYKEYQKVIVVVIPAGFHSFQEQVRMLFTNKDPFGEHKPCVFYYIKPYEILCTPCGVKPSFLKMYRYGVKLSESEVKIATV